MFRAIGSYYQTYRKTYFFATDAQISTERTLITREKSVEICASVAISCQLLKTRLRCINVMALGYIGPIGVLMALLPSHLRV